MQHDTLLILDFGSQLTQLIARRVREAQVYCEVYPSDVTEDWLRQYAQERPLKGIILAGGYTDTAEAGDRAPQAVFELGLPVLGIGYGMHTMALQLGGQLAQQGPSGFVDAHIQVPNPTGLLQDLAQQSAAWLATGEQVAQLPAGFSTLASAEGCAVAAMGDTSRHFYGLQFHPEESAHSPAGAALLARFAREICAAQTDWQMQRHIEEAVAHIKAQVGDEEVILGLSGGVDSTVCAALIHRAIGDQLTCVFVDHGLMRLNEGDMVMQMFADKLQAKVVRVDAENLFLGELAGVSEPEQKRKIIGRLFVDVFKAEAEKLKAARPGSQGVSWLAQGTIYPDIIESGGKKTATIKSHHNVGGLPEQLGLKLLEPLKDLFKDEVRELGVALGLPADMVYRHPFPGPGLGVRIVGEVKKTYADILRQADDLFIQALRNTSNPANGKSWYDSTSQAFAVFVPVKSVGVSGGKRVYDFVIALRAVETTDFMTARWAHLPYDLLEAVSTRIITQVDGVSRVTYDISSKPPATIEWE